MTEQLIGFETAKLAKEKGFNEQCSHRFREAEEEYYPEVTTNSKGDRVIEVTYKHFSNAKSVFYLRPTQSLLQKWLRDEHKKHIVIELVDNSRDYYWEYYITDGINREYNDEDFMDQAKNIYTNRALPTYEETLELALLEALRLI